MSSILVSSTVSTTPPVWSIICLPKFVPNLTALLKTHGIEVYPLDWPKSVSRPYADNAEILVTRQGLTREQVVDLCNQIDP